MPLDLITHKQRIRDGKTISIIVNPYVRLSHGDSPPIFIQGGKFWSEGGDEIEDLPEWALDELNKMNPVVRQEVGLDKPERKKASS